MLDATAIHADAQALRAAIIRARRRSQDFRLSTGPAGGGFISVDRLVDPRPPALARWLARERMGDRSSDAKCQAAYLIGHLARAVVEPLAELYLADDLVPRFDAGAASFRLERYRWRHDGRSGIGLRGSPRLDCRRLAEMGPVLACARNCGVEAGVEALQAGLTALLAPLVRRLRTQSLLGENALWRLVADMTASGFLNVGRRLDQEERARSIGLALTKAKGSPLNNAQTGYVEIVLPDASAPECAHDRRWFITRGGCCRWYTREGGEYCTVCVLRPPEERDALLLDYLREQQPKAVS